MHQNAEGAESAEEFLLRVLCALCVSWLWYYGPVPRTLGAAWPRTSSNFQPVGSAGFSKFFGEMGTFCCGWKSHCVVLLLGWLNQTRYGKRLFFKRMSCASAKSALSWTSLGR